MTTKEHPQQSTSWHRVLLNGKIRKLVIFGAVAGFSLSLLILVLVRNSLPIGVSQSLFDWMIIILSIILEVFGIGIFLDWLIEFSRRQRSEPRRQIALRRIFTAVGRDLFIQLARINSTDKPLTEKEDILISAKGMVTPSTNLPLHEYIPQLATNAQLASKEIEKLIDRFGDLFEIEFVNDLFQLVETAYLPIQSGLFIKYHVNPKEDEATKIKIANTVNETFDLCRKKLMQSCTEFIVEQIYPQSESRIKGLIRFHLLNFYVGYYPEICDLVLQGRRMKVTLNPDKL